MSLTIKDISYDLMRLNLGVIMDNFDPLFEQSVSDYLFNLNKFRRRKFQEAEVVKEIFEYYFRHQKECTEQCVENILKLFYAQLDNNKRPQR